MRCACVLLLLSCSPAATAEEDPPAGSTTDAGTTTTTATSSGPSTSTSTSTSSAPAESGDGSSSTGVSDAYPEDPDPLGPAACTADHVAYYPTPVPAGCAGRRSCIDEQGRWWVDDAPFIPRGLYNGGFEWAQLLDNCPAGEACEATTPADVDAYVAMVAEGGFNLIMERSRFTAELTAAINRNPDVYIAHLLWADPFADAAAHDSMVGEIEAAAADPDVVMWFGPDEVDHNDNFAMAAGIRRLLRGSDPELDDFLLAEYGPLPPPYLPETEPAHDPEGLPFGAALAWDWGLDLAPEIYDVTMPITYPFGSSEHPAHQGQWGTWRISDWNAPGRGMVPVLQMVGIPSMGLYHPDPPQVEALGWSAHAHGSHGAFHYNFIGDQPAHAGRDGWFAPDDADNWDAYRRIHAAEDALAPVVFSAAEVEAGDAPVQWRRYVLGERRVLVLVNPTAMPGQIDVDVLVERQAGEYVRDYVDCTPFTDRMLDVPAYGWRLLEVYVL